MSFPLTEEQQAVVDNRGGTLLVSAAAGSGKTRVLVERLLTRVEVERRNVDEFLVITFTNAAAAELRGRIAEALSDRLAVRANDPHLRRQTELIYKAQISTIHSLCIALLREYGHLLDLDPDWRLADESEVAILQLRALDKLLEERYAGVQAGDDFAQLVDTLSSGRDDRTLQTIVLDVFRKLQSHSDPSAWLDRQRTLFSMADIHTAEDTPWGRLLLDEAAGLAAFWAGRIEGLMTQCLDDEQLTRHYLPSLQVTAEDLRELARRARQGWDAASGVEVRFPRFGSVRDCALPDVQELVKALRARCKKGIEKLCPLIEGQSADLLGDLRALFPAVRGLFDLTTDFSAAFRAEKARRGVLDFGDLEHLTVTLLTDRDGQPTEHARQIGARWTELMVDEFQDTNEVQNRIFEALSQAGRNLFFVGDVRQSIYRFRLAEPGIFLEKYRTFPHHTDVDGDAPRKIILAKNFRSRLEVLDGVNALFSNIMSTEFGDMDYGAEEYLYPGAAFPPGEDNRVSLAVLDLGPIQRGRAEPPTDKDLIEARYAARRIRDMLDAGVRVSGEGGLRPAVPGDFAVLLRSPGPVLHHYIRAFGELNLPWQADGQADFFASTEVAVALSYLRIVDNPRQDVPLIAVLRSPACGFTADRLAALRAGRTEVDFYTVMREDDGADCAAFLKELDRLRFGAADRSSHELLWELYEQTNLLGIFSAMDSGAVRRANLLALYELARQFEAGGHRGLYGFLSHLSRLEEAGRQPVGRGGIGTAGGVTIQSIHKSKGLEYPIVLLCGLSRKLNREDEKAPMLFHKTLGLGPKGLDAERMILYPTLARLAIARQLDREMMAEELRLLYVAMTRAREKLIMVCTVHGAAELKRLTAEAFSPVDPQALAAAASVGQWVLLHALCRTEAAELHAMAETMPPACDRARIYDKWEVLLVPGAAYEAAPPPLPRAQTTAESGGTDPDDVRAAILWRYPHQAAAETPSKLTATQLKGRNLDSEVAAEAPPDYAPRPIRVPRLDGAPRQLTPTERGAALHLVLQFIDIAKTDDLAEIRREIARLTERNVLTREQAAVVDPARLLALFQSEYGRAARAAAVLYREFKFSLLVPAERYYPQLPPEERVLLQGVVDCWYETEAGLVVLDFKTDRVTDETVAARAASYKPQLAAYGEALEEMTGRRVVKRVLWFFALDRGIEL